MAGVPTPTPANWKRRLLDQRAEDSVMIRRIIEKRRAERVFKRLAGPETVKAVLHEPGEEQPLRQGRIEFILAFVRGENPTRVSEHVSQVVDLAGTHGAAVQTIIGALVVVTFVTSPGSPASTTGRLSLVQTLREQLASDLKLVHGAAEGHYGLFGSKERIVSFTFLVPRFDHALGALGRLGFGESEEFR